MCFQHKCSIPVLVIKYKQMVWKLTQNIAVVGHYLNIAMPTAVWEEQLSSNYSLLPSIQWLLSVHYIIWIMYICEYPGRTLYIISSAALAWPHSCTHITIRVWSYCTRYLALTQEVLLTLVQFVWVVLYVWRWQRFGAVFYVVLCCRWNRSNR